MALALTQGIQMNEQTAVELLTEKIREFATLRARDVARNAETARLAALLLDKYGTGIAEAVSAIFGSPRAADPIIRILDQEKAKIDPSWRENAQARWAARPADVVDLSEGNSQPQN
jgi:hypothetical protein